MELREGYIKTEVGTLPVDWELKPFYKITDAITCGVAATPKYVDESEGKPFLSASHVQNGKVIPLDYKYIPVELYNQITKHNKPEKGDILYTRVGAGIGEAGVIDFDLDFAIYVSLTLIKPKKNLNSYYLKSLLNSDYYRFLAKRDQFAGGGVQNLNVGVVREFPIPIPPTIEEQIAIATALSDADALINCLEKLIAKKRNIKQGAMQKLLQPKEGWEVKKLGEIAEIYQPQTISQDVFVEDGYLVYGANGVIGKFHLFNHETWQTTITCRGSTCGTVNRTIDKSWITGNAMVMNVDENRNIDKLFFYYILTKQDFSQCITGSGQPQIVRSPLFDFTTSIPKSKEKQKEIAFILSDMDAEINALETKLEKYRKIKLGMMQNLLTGKIRLI